jgi:hypothetical protein
MKQAIPVPNQRQLARLTTLRAKADKLTEQLAATSKRQEAIWARMEAVVRDVDDIGLETLLGVSGGVRLDKELATGQGITQRTGTIKSFAKGLFVVEFGPKSKRVTKEVAGQWLTPTNKINLAGPVA